MSLKMRTFVVIGLVCLGMSLCARGDNIFVSTDTTDSNSIDENNYIVGADTSLNPLSGSATFTVSGGVYGDVANALFGPYGLIFDIGVFGAFQSNITGTTQGLNLFNTSSGTVSGGFSQNSSVYDSATFTVNGGTSNNTFGYISGTTNLENGQINDYAGYENAVLNVSGGTASSVTLNDSSILNISGGTVTTLATNAGTTTNITGTGAVTNITGNGTVNYGSQSVVLSLPTVTIAQPTTLTNVSVSNVTVLSATAIVNNDLTTAVVNEVDAENSANFTLANGIVGLVSAINTANVTISQGIVSTLQAANSASVAVNNGVVSVLNLGDASTGVVASGTVTQANVSNQAQLSVVAGTVAPLIQAVTLTDQAKLNVAGQVSMPTVSIPTVDIQNSASASIIQAEVGTIKAQNTASVALNNSTVTNLNLVDSSIATIIQGTVNQITVANDANVSAGVGAAISSIKVGDQGVAQLAAIIGQPISAAGAAQITANSLASIKIALQDAINLGPTALQADSALDSFETVDLFDQSTLTIYSNPTLELTSLGTGSDSNGTFNDYAVYAMNPNNSLTDTLIRIQDYDGLTPGDPNQGLSNAGNVDFLPAPVPEPTALSLIAIAAASALGRRRPRRA